MPFRGLGLSFAATASGTIQMTMMAVARSALPRRVAPLLGELGYAQIGATYSLTLDVPEQDPKEIEACDIRNPLAEESAGRLRVNGKAIRTVGVQEDWFGRVLPAGRRRRIIGEKR